MALIGGDIWNLECNYINFFGALVSGNLKSGFVESSVATATIYLKLPACASLPRFDKTPDCFEEGTESCSG